MFKVITGPIIKHPNRPVGVVKWRMGFFLKKMSPITMGLGFCTEICFILSFLLFVDF